MAHDELITYVSHNSVFFSPELDYTSTPTTTSLQQPLLDDTRALSSFIDFNDSELIEDCFVHRLVLSEFQAIHIRRNLDGLAIDLLGKIEVICGVGSLGEWRQSVLATFRSLILEDLLQRFDDY